MSQQCVIAEYSSIQDATVAMEVLEKIDFTREQVSLVSRHSDSSSINGLKDYEVNSPPVAESAVVGGAAGGALIGTLAAGTLIGPFMVAGPLVGIALGAGTGAALASTDKWGVDENVASDLTKRVEQGAVLVIVNDDDSIVVDDAERSLKTTKHSAIHRFQRD